MSTDKFIDVAEFFNQQLKDQSIEPPAQIWDKVQEQIPEYPKTSFGKWYLAGTIVAILSISAIWFLNKNSQTTAKALKIQTSSISVPERNVAFTADSKQKGKYTQYVNLKNNQRQNSNVVKNAILNLEASNYSNIEQILFYDSTKALVKTIKLPAINEFGFYALDVSKLKPGRYTLNISCKGGKIYNLKQYLH